MNTQELIENFRDCCQTHGFKWEPGKSVLSTNPKLLFNISGGVRFEETIASGKTPSAPIIASVQPCIRTDTLEKIGISGRHHLAFLMLEHFSMYQTGEEATKRLMITTAWNYLVDWVKLDITRLAITIHPRDQVTRSIWQEIGVKIYDSAENTDINPDRNRSGVRTEIMWQWNHPDKPYLELMNIVFTQFDGPVMFQNPMSLIASDSGMSLERLITATENTTSNYDTTLWRPLITTIQNIYAELDASTAQRLADFGRAIAWLIQEGLRPGNKAANYVLRKIIREAYMLVYGLEPSTDLLIDVWCEHWLDFDAETTLIKQVVRIEIELYRKTLDRGYRECEKLLKHNESLQESDFDYLASTHGYPRVLAEKQQQKWSDQNG